MSILVIDDQPDVVTVVVRILRNAGHITLGVSDPSEAVAIAKSIGHLELVIIDAVMPGTSGPELAEQLVRACFGLKVLFMSGLQPFAVNLAFGQPCESIQKPFTAAELRDKIQHVMAVGPTEELTKTATLN